MSIVNELQVDFSGGEISPRMLMREDSDLHAKSLLEMLNFYPTFQGTAARNPGSKFIMEIPGSPTTARIIPYILPNGARALIYITPRVGAVLGNIEILAGIDDVSNAPTFTLNYDFIVDNGDLSLGHQNWTFDKYNNGNRGWIINNGWFNLKVRTGHNTNSGDSNGIVSGPFTIPETTDHIIVAPDVFYNWQGDRNYGVTVEIRIGTSLYASDISLITVSNLVLQGPHYIEKTVVNGTFNAGEVYYISLFGQANSGPGNDGNHRNDAEIVVEQLNVLSLVTKDIGPSLLPNVVDYLASEIGDVHFVQSPYTAVDILNEGAGKELVLTHPNHPPKRLYLGTPDYEFEDIFTNDGLQHYLQWDWDTNGHPATCGSYNGRLVLAGSSDGAATVNGSNSETVWCTEVGDWGKFTDEAVTELVPSNSISFTSIYRSTIKWVQGQKELLIGAGDMEYTASAEGIFQPADLGVTMQSTHGSNRVQPAPMGSYVLFPAEGGTKLRSMQYASEALGWVAPDMTIVHPGLLSSGIKRMVRMRNPHQMCVVLMGNGQLALFHIDSNSQIYGWSRVAYSGNIIDISVVSDSNGVDVLYILIKRNIEGVNKIYLEAIIKWTDKDDFRSIYLESNISILAQTPDNIITGLDHLEGREVQVINDLNYLGFYTVTGGQITLVNQIGDPINFVNVVLGLPMRSVLRTLPLISSEPGGMKRYVSVSVRTLGSSRPLINGDRVADRSPTKILDSSQGWDIVYDNEVQVMGSDEYQVITVEEDLPYRLEVVGIFGPVKESSV